MRLYNREKKGNVQKSKLTARVSLDETG